MIGGTSGLEASVLGVNESNRVVNLVAEIVESDILRRTRYEWTSLDVTRQFSKYRWSSMVELHAVSMSMLAKNVVEGELTLEHCVARYNVFHC